MAKRRMISGEIINTDCFINLSLAARGLYMHLNSVADDDGFIASPVSTTNMVGGSFELLNELINRGYLIRFDSGICLITHWFLHNQLKSDRYTPTIHETERSKVVLENKLYRFLKEGECIQNGSKSDTQIRTEKINKDNSRVMPTGHKAREPATTGTCQVKKNSFNNFPQRTDYDFEELERMLLSSH